MRANLSSTSDAVTSASRPGRGWLTLATEVPGNPGASQLTTRFSPGGNDSRYYPATTATGEQSLFAGHARPYRVRVAYNYDYEGEYRLRATLVPSATYQVETENNDSVSNAKRPPWPDHRGRQELHQQATIAGAVVMGDGGDFFYLGNLTAAPRSA